MKKEVREGLSCVNGFYCKFCVHLANIKWYIIKSYIIRIYGNTKQT